MLSYHYPIIAREGWQWIALALILAIGVYLLFGWLSLPLWILSLLLLIMFRDPERQVPASPLGIVSPADGKVIKTETVNDPFLNRTAVRVSIQMNIFSVYSIHSPMEGKLMEQWCRVGQQEAGQLTGTGNDRAVYAQWIQSDEGDDLVMLTQAGSFGNRPRCYAQSGERIGQGQRCGFIQFGSVIDVLLPETSRLDVVEGDRVRAGSDIIAHLVHPVADVPEVIPAL